MHTFNTGDIHFASALLTIGFSMNEQKPCSLISHENGNVYSRYHFQTVSNDGKLDANVMSKAWSNNTLLPSDHGLNQVSQFIRRGAAKMSIADWIDLAQSIFSIGHVTNLQIAADHVAAFPDNPESYALAYICNRDQLFKLHNKARREIFMTNGDARTLIDLTLPKHQQKELRNRLNG
jgi:hypothetical protein